MSDSPTPDDESVPPTAADSPTGAGDSAPPDSVESQSAPENDGDGQGDGQARPSMVAGEGPGRRPGGGWQDIEDGVGALFQALERGVLNIADAEGRKRKARAAAASTSGSTESAGDIDGDAGVPNADAPQDRGPAASDDGADETRADNSPRADARPEPAAQEMTADETGDVAPGRPPRPGMTYDEVLTPTRWRNVFFGVTAAIVLAALYWAVSLAQVVAAADNDERRDVDAIVVLGAAQFDGTPSPVLAARLDHALELWEQGLADVIVTTGANREGDRFTEGFSGFVYLRDAGVPEASIINIIDGVDTYQQMTATQGQMLERELTTAVLVSDGYHNFRLESIANEIGLDAWVSPTGVDATTDDYLRESAAVSFGRLFGYRRISAWNNPVDETEPVEVDGTGDSPGDEPVDDD